jgi:hypothetical protein
MLPLELDLGGNDLVMFHDRQRRAAGQANQPGGELRAQASRSREPVAH